MGTYRMPGAIQEEQQSVNPEFSNFRMPGGTIQDNVAEQRPFRDPSPTIADVRAPDPYVAPTSRGAAPRQTSAPATIAPVAAKSEPLFSGDDIQAGVGSVLNQVTQQSTAAGVIATNKYNEQIDEWKRNGQFWMDPSADVAPDLNSYLDAMPSRQDALLEGQWLNEIHGENSWLGAFLDPTTSIATAAAGDDGAKTDWASYVSSEGLEGAAGGFSTGGWVGAVVGAVIGVITGISDWSGAGDEDKENAKKARAEHGRLMKSWQQRQYYRTQTAARAGEVQRAQAEASLAERKKSEKKQDKQEKVAQSTTRRQQFSDLMDYMQRYSTQYRNYRQQKWA